MNRLNILLSPDPFSKKTGITGSSRLAAAMLLLISVSGCNCGLVVDEEAYSYPNSPYEEAWIDEHTDNDANLGPNSPGYLGPDGEYSVFPDSDPQ